MNNDLPIVLAYGGGTNSTALLCGFREKGLCPSLICFADTGGEHPRTYEHVDAMNQICLKWFGIKIEIVRKTYKGQFEGLEGECLRANKLPSLAYGGKHCSVKYKADPQDMRLRKWMKEGDIPAARRAIGFGLDEPWRVKVKFDVIKLNQKRTIHSWYPLVEWEWRRIDCIQAIARHNIPQPGKSSCFFCPARKVGEVLALRQTDPDLFQRGLDIEAAAAKNKLRNNGRENAKLGQGLHFGTKWSDMASADDAQLKLFEWDSAHASAPAPCGCYDG
jgi:hypothetical protein